MQHATTHRLPRACILFSDLYIFSTRFCFHYSRFHTFAMLCFAFLSTLPLPFLFSVAAYFLPHLLLRLHNPSAQRVSYFYLRNNAVVRFWLFRFDINNLFLCWCTYNAHCMLLILLLAKLKAVKKRILFQLFRRFSFFSLPDLIPLVLRPS